MIATCRQLVLCCGSGRKVRDGRHGLHCEMAGLGETLHSCAAFSLAYGSGKYLYTLVQYLAILPTKPGNKIHVYVLTIAFLPNFLVAMHTSHSDILLSAYKYPSITSTSIHTEYVSAQRLLQVLQE